MQHSFDVDVTKSQRSWNTHGWPLKDLCSRWSGFEPLYREQIGEEQEKKDEVVIEKAENLIKNGNIDEAIQIMKGGE